ncbi:hypothetical protein ACU5AY_05960 [Rhizobium sp. PAMB 3174]
MDSANRPDSRDDFDDDEFDRELEKAETERKPLWPLVVAGLVLIVSVASSIAGVARTMGWLGG